MTSVGKKDNDTARRLETAIERLQKDGYHLFPYDEGQLDIVKKALLAEKPFVDRAIKLALLLVESLINTHTCRCKLPIAFLQ